MKLLKHELCNIFPRREVSLYKKDNSWYKEINLIDGKFFNEDETTSIDVKMIKLFAEKFDWVATPYWMTYENNIFKYEIEDFSNHQDFFDCTFEEQLAIVSKIIDAYRDCLKYSKELGHDDIFFHNDIRPHNMIIYNKNFKLIDLDSFRWINKYDYSNYITSTINNIMQMLDLKYL